MKNISLIINKFKCILILVLLFATSIVSGQDSKTLLTKALNDATFETKRGIIKPDEADFRLDYDDIYEEDSHAKFLQEKGYHGGGPSWLGILYGAFSICENDLINQTDSDVSVTGVSFWSSKKEELEMIRRVIQVIKSDEKILLEVIEIAKQNEMML